MTPFNPAFCLFGALTIVTCVALIHYFRVAFINVRIRQQTDACHAERERIARDLHDTVLQGIQALVFRLQMWAEDLDLPKDRRDEIAVVVAQAKAIISEGRDRIVALRHADVERKDFVGALTAIGSNMTGGEVPTYRIRVSGEPRPIVFETSQQLMDITREAVRNAYVHAQCAEVEVSIDYRKRYLRLTIADDGIGFNSTIGDQEHQVGHFGILGMQERALQLRARFSIEANGQTGTKVSITVPACAAFIKDHPTLWGRLAILWKSHTPKRESFQFDLSKWP